MRRTVAIVPVVLALLAAASCTRKPSFYCDNGVGVYYKRHSVAVVPGDPRCAEPSRG